MEVEGKVCVCETLGGDALKEALLYAKSEKALALIVTEEPEKSVDVPTILISRDQLRSIKDDLPGAVVSVFYTSGSYDAHSATFILQSFCMDEANFDEWDGKIFVPVGTTDHLDLEHEWVYEAVAFRNEQGGIVEFLNKNEMAGSICLVGDCTSDRQFTQILRLAAQYGATALFTTYASPPLHDIPLPVVVVEKKLFHQMKKPLMKVFFKYRSDAQSKASKLESKATLTAEMSYASALQGGASKSSSKKSDPQAKPVKKNYWEIFGDAVVGVGRTVGLMKYFPQSKERFNAILAKGTSWSNDLHLYLEAIELLVWVDSVEDSQDRLTELEALNEALRDMINDHSGVGDVMIVSFCAKLHHSLSPGASLRLMTAAVEMITNIKIDESDSISAYVDVDAANVDKYIAKLAQFLSGRPLNKGSMKGFVLNALWIRVHHCQSLKNGLWDSLQAIATRTFFKDEQETLLSFVPLPLFNTLAVRTAASFQDVCVFFSGEDKVSVLRAAIPGLLRLYRDDRTARTDWQKEFGSIREVTALTLLDRFEVETGDNEISKAETNFINRIVQCIERNPTQVFFSDCECVYDCLRVESNLSDIVTELMMKSIRSSLEDWHDVLSPTSVCELLQMNIGRNLLSDSKGFFALKSYTEHGLFKRYRGQDKEKLVLLGRINSSLSKCESCTDEEAANVILDAIRSCIITSGNCYELCLTVMGISQRTQDIFNDGHNSNLPSLIGKMFIRETGICSTIRSSPSKLRNVTSRLQSRPDGSLSHFLHQALVRGLKDECKNIDNAISFYESFCESDSGHSIESRNIVYEIVINSFGNWNPSSIIDLLNFDAPLLKAIHDILVTISSEGGCEESHQKQSSDCLESMRDVADNWREKKFEKDKLNMTELMMAKRVMTDAKQEVLTNFVGGSQFPSPSDIDEKVAEMNDLVETIRSSLTFSVTKDNDTFTRSFLDLATLNRIIEYPLSRLISRYFSGADPGVDLCSIRRDSKHILDFVSAHKKELQAAAHFQVFRSALFQNEVGVWTEIHIDDFFPKVSASLQQLEFLLSPAASFSSVSAAAIVLDRDNVGGFDDEMTAIISFLRPVGDEQTREGLKDVMTLAKLAKQLSNFVECCKTFKFACAESDDSFGELETICNRMNSDEGGEWDIDQCLLTGKRIVEILQPPSISADLSQQLQYYLPLIEFFDALRHCCSILDLAREKRWFGKKGLSTFYKQYENVTNVLNQKQSYEMAVLDRLEPTIQCISAVGDNLQCDRVATLLHILNENSYFSRQNIKAMQTIQENICKIQDWLSEGMDDMAAILSKFALIQSSGRIVIGSEDSMDEATPPKREMLLHFSRSDGSTVIMNESEVRELVQYLGFTTHESDESRMEAERFVRVFEQCGKVMASHQEMADVGFGDNDATKILEFILGEHSEDLALEWLGKADKMIDECKGWLRQVRSSNRCCLLFSMDELKIIFQCLCDIRSRRSDEGSLEWQLLLSILSEMPLLNSNCSNLIAQFAAEASSGRSWLEHVSIFVSECGNQRQLDNPSSSHGSKRVIIHKVDCLDNTIFSAQLQVLRHIFQVSMIALHYCTPFHMFRCCSHSSLCLLLVNQNRSPASFEYLDASCIKSSDHVALFLERVRSFPEHIFVIAYVERLAAMEQELIATFIAKHAKSADIMHLHCIQSKDTVLYASPGVSISSWNDSSLSEYYPSPWLQDCVASKGHVSDITIVFSDTPGSGKTRFIRSELERTTAAGAQIASIYIHEDFTLTKAVKQLRDKFGEGGPEDKSVHFGFSWSCDAKPSDEFLLSVNHFFNSFLLFGNVYDPMSGNSFYGSSRKWNVFVEMNVCVGGEDAAQVWLREHVPVLSYCSLHILQPPSAFLIDEKARRVATYLRAYDNGSIDRKFNSTPANKTILFVLDTSRSMGSLIGGRTTFQVASESMLSVFNSHIRVMDVSRFSVCVFILCSENANMYLPSSIPPERRPRLV